MRPAGLALLVATAAAVPAVAGATPDPGRCWTARVAAAAAIARAAPAPVAFAMRDPRGRTWTFRGRRAFPSASLLKTTLMVAALRRPAVASMPLGVRTRSLLDPMIRRSDNTATNVLVGELPAAAITGAARATGQRDFAYRLPIWGLSRTSAADQVRLFAALDTAVPARHQRYARSLLRRIVPAQRWGLARVAPRGWTVLFKGGWGSGTGRITSQTARLERGGSVWIISVLTERNASHAAGVALIERIGRALMRVAPC